jgi:hypothetical protein
MNVQKDALAKRFGFLKLNERSECHFKKLPCRQFWLHLCLHKGGCGDLDAKLFFCYNAMFHLRYGYGGQANKEY